MSIGLSFVRLSSTVIDQIAEHLGAKKVKNGPILGDTEGIGAGGPCKMGPLAQLSLALRVFRLCPALSSSKGSISSAACAVSDLFSSLFAYILELVIQGATIVIYIYIFIYLFIYSYII